MFCAFETTRDFNSLLPVMLVCVLADAVTYYLMPASIMTQKFAKRGMAVPGEYEAGVLKSVRVGEIMTRNVPVIAPDVPVGEVAERLAKNAPGFDVLEGVPIVSSEGELMGIVTQRDLLRALQEDPSGQRAVLPAKPRKLIVAYDDEVAYEALLRMLRNDVGRLPVVKRTDPRRLVGYLNRASFLAAWTRQIEEEFVRERGWLHFREDSEGRVPKRGRKTGKTYDES
jgi:CBS domain-containing protein